MRSPSSPIGRLPDWTRSIRVRYTLLYSTVLFGLAAPWAILLPAALIQAHARRSRGDRFALAYFWAVFLFFTLSSSRRSYYLLPILPAAALLIGRLLATPLAALTPWSRRLAKAGFWSVAVVTLLAAGVFIIPRSMLPAPWDGFPALPEPIAFAAVFWRQKLIGTISGLLKNGGTLGRVVAAALILLVVLPVLAGLFFAGLGLGRTALAWVIRRGYGRSDAA